MELNYKHFGSGQPLVILHGLFGSLDNWATIAKKFAEHYSVYIVDQRNHGQSPHSDKFTYDVMADDLKEFIVNNGIDQPIVLGHSMGGKTAMLAALKYPDIFKKLIVVDIAPKQYQVHHRQILDGLLSLDFEQLNSRKDADAQLAHYIPEMGVRQFLLKNLYWQEKERLALRFNLDVLNREIEPISGWMDRAESFLKPTLFIRGGKSEYMTDNEPSIRTNFENSRLETIENSGHWVHAEAPADLYNSVVTFIQK